MNVKFESCKAIYWEFVRMLRQDTRVKDGFINNTYINQQDQINYMTKFGKFYYIALIDDIPVGYVGVINEDIRVCTHPDYHGKGIGKFMINEIHKLYPNAIAKVKKSNEASSNLFLSCNFIKQSEDKQFIYYKKINNANNTF